MLFHAFPRLWHILGLVTQPSNGFEDPWIPVWGHRKTRQLKRQGAYAHCRVACSSWLCRWRSKLRSPRWPPSLLGLRSAENVETTVFGGCLCLKIVIGEKAWICGGPGCSHLAIYGPNNTESDKTAVMSKPELTSFTTQHGYKREYVYIYNM